MNGDIYEFSTAGEHPILCREIPRPNKFVRLLADNELPEALRKRDLEDTAPMTVQLLTDKQTVNFTEAMQRFIYGLNPGLIPSRFEHIIDTWNVTGKVRDCRNYITGERLDADLPKYHSYLSMGNNIHKVKGEPFYLSGVLVYELERIDISKPMPLSIPDYLKIHLVIWAAGRVIEFPQRDGMPCYAALMSAAPLYIDARRVVVVE